MTSGTGRRNGPTCSASPLRTPVSGSVRPSLHNESSEFVRRVVIDKPWPHVLDIGGRDVNGTIRHFFPGSQYVSLDLARGSAVDIVADAADWEPDRLYDLVICMSVFEHTPRWPDIIKTVHKALRPGGTFVLTTVGYPFPAHSAGGGPADDWPYAGVTMDEVRAAMTDFTIVESATTPGGDVLIHATSTRP